MSIELHVATRHRRDMTEKLLKATLNPNTHTESKVVTDHLLPAQIEVLHVPDVDILDYKF